MKNQTRTQALAMLPNGYATYLATIEGNRLLLPKNEAVACLKEMAELFPEDSYIGESDGEALLFQFEDDFPTSYLPNRDGLYDLEELPLAIATEGNKAYLAYIEIQSNRAPKYEFASWDEETGLWNVWLRAKDGKRLRRLCDAEMAEIYEELRGAM